MITLNQTTQTGIILVTHGAPGVVSTTGPFGQNARLAMSYSFSGATSGVFAGWGELRNGNFYEEMRFPGNSMKFVLNGADGYTSVNIECKESP